MMLQENRSFVSIFLHVESKNNKENLVNNKYNLHNMDIQLYILSHIYFNYIYVIEKEKEQQINL